ncbi:hypothetical protein INT43_001455 [Umbelopsis isabellina]|uniref:Uncharacterized protein n=1 Tax=Mortierella isabellina TaxID=91625 RepID=A0A8H7PE48_MORIS|nr:hypothetical protein INT43_001455 [Umbelopsis isabellina]
MKFTLTALLLANAIAISYARCNIALVSPAKSSVGQFNNRGSGCSTAQLAGLKCKSSSSITNTDGNEDVRQYVCASNADYASDYATLRARGIFWGVEGATPAFGTCNAGGVTTCPPVTLCGRKIA